MRFTQKLIERQPFACVLQETFLMAEIRGTASNNIYTVLALIALVALVIGIGFIAIRTKTIFGTANPFSIEISQAGPPPITTVMV